MRHGDQSALIVPAGCDTAPPAPLPADARLAIAAAQFNAALVQRMLDACVERLEARGVARERITVVPVPGAYELPLAAQRLADTGAYLAVVTLGCVIRGGTPHFDYICAEAARGTTLAALETGVPVVFGVLTCDTLEQAEERADPARLNKGAEFADAGLDLALALRSLG